MAKLPVSLDLEKLGKLAGAVFTDDEIHDLVDLTSAYAGRFREDLSMPDCMAIHTVHELPSTSEFAARRAYVEAVSGIWRDRSHARGYGSAYRPEQEVHDGPVVKLLLYLLAGARVSPLPSAATLHHDLVALALNEERPRDRKQR